MFASENVPNFINALVNLGSVNFELNKYEDAIELYNKALSLNDNNGQKLIWYLRIEF